VRRSRRGEGRNMFERRRGRESFLKRGRRIIQDFLNCGIDGGGRRGEV